MSFHDRASDLSRLNHAGVGKPVEVHPYTYEVLQQAIKISAFSSGCFDVTIGAELVEWDQLPRPVHTGEIPHGSWKDIELLASNRVVSHRPLWIDLGGIAKGFAVDRATDYLRKHGALQTVVNAGGDIRVQGKDAEPIQLSGESTNGRMPVLELMDGSVASSSGHLQRRWHKGRLCGPHVDGLHRTPAPTDRFVSVVAERCTIADALTKVVMVQGAKSASVLRLFGASAYFHDSGQGWQHVETARAMAG
jgi:thiamine biosynthesis lipoprotein